MASNSLSQAAVNSQALGTAAQPVSAMAASGGTPSRSAGGGGSGLEEPLIVTPWGGGRGRGKPTPFTIRKTSDGNSTKYLIYLPEGSFTVDGVFLPANWAGAGVVGSASDNSPAWYDLDVSAGSSIYLTMTPSDSSGERTVQLSDSEPTDEDNISYSLLVASIDSDGNVNQQTCGPIHLVTTVVDTKALSFYSRKRLEDNSAVYADQVPEQFEDSQVFLSLSGFFHSWGSPEWFGKDDGDPRYCSMFHEDVPNAHFVVRFVSEDGGIELGYLPLSVVFLYFMHSLSDHLTQIRNGTDPDVNSSCQLMRLASVITEAAVEYIIRRFPCLEELCGEDPDDPGGGGEDPDDPAGATLTLTSGDNSNIMFTMDGTTSNTVSIPLDKSSEVKIDAYYV